MRPQLEQTTTEKIASFISQNFYIPPVAISDLVKESLALDVQDIAQIRDIYDNFKAQQIETADRISLQDRETNAVNLSNLFQNILGRTREYFAQKEADVSRFEEGGQLGKYIAQMVDQSKDDQKTYSELICLADKMVDFINLVASKTNNNQNPNILQKYIANLPLQQEDMACIPGVTERFLTLSNELKGDFVMDVYKGLAVIEENKMAQTVYEGNQIHIPLFLLMILGVETEESANQKDRFVLGLKTQLSLKNVWESSWEFYRNFNKNFIKQLSGLYRDSKHIFDYDFENVVEDANLYPMMSRAIEGHFGFLGLGIDDFINNPEDENIDPSWKTNQQIGELIAERLNGKYPNLKTAQFSQLSQGGIENILRPIKELFLSSKESYLVINQLLKSQNSDEVFIGLQAIYLAAQPFKNGQYQLMVDVLYHCIWQTVPKTKEDFANKVDEFLDQLKNKIPQSHHFKIDDLKARCKDKRTKPHLLLSASKYKNFDLLQAIIDDVMETPEAIVTALQNCGSNKNKLKLLKKKNISGHTMLHQAVHKGSPELIAAILKNCGGNENKMYLLLQQDIDFETVFHSAVYNLNAGAAIEAILQNCGDNENKMQLLKLRDNDGDTIIAITAFKGKLEATKAILRSLNSDEKSTLLNQQDWVGKTILHKLAESGQFKEMAFLYENGANIEIVNRQSKTPIGIGLDYILQLISNHPEDQKRNLDIILSLINPQNLSNKIMAELREFQKQAPDNLKSFTLLNFEGMAIAPVPSSSLALISANRLQQPNTQQINQ